MQDPQSLHKYLYVHGDPVQGLDPTGQFSLGGLSVNISARNVGIGLAIGIPIALTLGWGLNSSKRSIERATIIGQGGKDITRAVEALGSDFDTWWAALSPVMRQQVFNEAHSTSGWDAKPLNEPQELQRSSFGTSPDWAPRTVTVQDKVYYAHEVNYFLWGYLYARANQEGLDAKYTDMLTWIRRWRSAGQLAYFFRAHDGDTDGRQWWAIAGWEMAQGGNLEAPSSAALPRATPTAADEYITGFQVQVGSGNFLSNF